MCSMARSGRIRRTDEARIAIGAFDEPVFADLQEDARMSESGVNFAAVAGNTAFTHGNGFGGLVCHGVLSLANRRGS